jgi:hypothetical protein
MVDIEGKQFTLFWDMDRAKLPSLTFGGRALWLRHRLDFTLLRPIDAIIEREADVFPWLAVTELVCAGIEALAGFYGDKQHGTGTPFCRFVYDFMHGDYARKAPDGGGENKTYCEHLQSYFRNGLAHGFGIEWGGLWNADTQNLQGYLRPNLDGRGIAVCPKALLRDFRQAIQAYFECLACEGENSLMGRNFVERFEAILQQTSKLY